MPTHPKSPTKTFRLKHQRRFGNFANIEIRHIDFVWRGSLDFSKLSLLLSCYSNDDRRYGALLESTDRFDCSNSHTLGVSSPFATALIIAFNIVIVLSPSSRASTTHSSSVSSSSSSLLSKTISNGGAKWGVGGLMAFCFMSI